MAKIDIMTDSYNAELVCTNCNTELCYDGYIEMTAIVGGKYKFCPNCGKKFEGVMIDNKDFNNCAFSLRTWASGNKCGVLPFGSYK